MIVNPRAHLTLTGIAQKDVVLVCHRGTGIGVALSYPRGNLGVDAAGAPVATGVLRLRIGVVHTAILVDGQTQILGGAAPLSIGRLLAGRHRAVSLRRAVVLVQPDDASTRAASISEVLARFPDTPGGSATSLRITIFSDTTLIVFHALAMCSAPNSVRENNTEKIKGLLA